MLNDGRQIEITDHGLGYVSEIIQLVTAAAPIVVGQLQKSAADKTFKALIQQSQDATDVEQERIAVELIALQSKERMGTAAMFFGAALFLVTLAVIT